MISSFVAPFVDRLAGLVGVDKIPCSSAAGVDVAAACAAGGYVHPEI